MAQLMPLPNTVSCFSKIQIGFTFLVPAHPGSPGKMAVKWVCVCVCVYLATAPVTGVARRSETDLMAVRVVRQWSKFFSVGLSSIAVRCSCHNSSVFSFLRQLTTWHCPHAPRARRCCCVQPYSSRSLSPARRAHSSKPAARCCSGR